VISAVLDANTIVSATISQRSAPHQLLLAARARRFQLVTSAVIVAEVLRALARPRVTRRYRLSAADVNTTRRLLMHEATTTRLTVTVHGVASHPEDDLVRATALSGGATHLATYDQKLRELSEYRGVQIISPYQLLSIINAQDAS